jgi:hypothetical protein
VHLTWVTSSGAAVDHGVADDAMAAGLTSGGMFVAVCGARFLPASMCAEPGPVCSSCRLLLEARRPLARVRVNRHRVHRPGLVARLVAVLATAPPARSDLRGDKPDLQEWLTGRGQT